MAGGASPYVLPRQKRPGQTSNGVNPVRSSLVPLEIRLVIDMPAIAKSDLSLTGLAEVLRTRVFDASETSYGVN